MKKQLETFSVTGPYYKISARYSKVVLDPETNEEYEVGNHRTTYGPTEDLSEAPLPIQRVAEVLWTPKVVEEYKTMLESTIIDR